MLPGRAATDLPALVSRYADRFHAAVGDDHHVASPLGAWLLLALVGPLAEGPDRRAIEDVLGCPVAPARAAVDALLASPDPAVGAALAGWADLAEVGAAVAAWLEALPTGTDRGPVPTQDEADRWAREHTFGLIERFPLGLQPDTLLVLASALATRVGWQQPFQLRPASELGGSFTTSVDHILHTAARHETWLADTAGGRVVVVEKLAEGLVVRSVLGPRGATAAAVLDAAHELSRTPGRPAQVSLFDVALGDGDHGTITERTYASTGTSDRVETAEAWLPAWEAESDHELMRDERLGFTTAGAVLVRTMPDRAEGFAVEARQSAMARSTRLGFEAAAVTAMAVRAGAAMPREVTVTERHLAARFDRPFAVVAATVGGFGPDGPSPWTGLPVFSAWVTDAIEPPD